MWLIVHGIFITLWVVYSWSAEISNVLLVHLLLRLDCAKASCAESNSNCFAFPCSLERKKTRSLDTDDGHSSEITLISLR